VDLAGLEKVSTTEWRIEPTGAMRVPAILFADEALVRDMDEKVREQAVNVATLPGIVRAAYAMPDAHWGYGFPIGGVAAFDAEEGGVVSAGGVGFDISCGVRTHLTGLPCAPILAHQRDLAQALFRTVPVGVGSTGKIALDEAGMTAMLAGGARWALEQGYGRASDLERIEERGCAADVDPAAVSDDARRRQRKEMGTLGSGNHYLEVQEVAEVLDAAVADAFGLKLGECVVTIHCGSRGLGHQIGTEFLREMAIATELYGIALPDRELACAPIKSELGSRYLGAMRAAINCALANRQIIGHLARQVFARFFADAPLPLLFDVSHNTCKVERHEVDGRPRRLYVHRKGATRAFGPGHPSLPEALKPWGQPVLIGGSMGTSSFVLVGTPESETHAFASACHGAGRRMSRHQATRTWAGREVIDELAARGIIVLSPSARGVAEEAPGAYKDVIAVVDAAEQAGLARKVARLAPLICIKG
jgi:tRNA-splicing ligase RtcB